MPPLSVPLDVAAWGLFEKRNVETLSRVASARTLDGYKVRARISLNFTRAMVAPEAESVMMQYARAFAGAVERELSGGELPFEEPELLDVIVRKVDALPKERVRIAGLHVWHKGAISSRSMQAVRPAGNDNPTVPAMRAVRAPSSAHTEASRSLAPDTRRTSQPSLSSPSAAGTTRRAAPSATSYSTVNPRSTDPARLKPTVTNLPAQAPSISEHSFAASVVDARAPRHSTLRSPPVSGRRPVIESRGASNPVTTNSDLRPAPATSGTVAAVDPKIRTASGFSRAVGALEAPSESKLGRALGKPVRDAAASLLFASLEAAQATLDDPLLLLEPAFDGQVRNQLVSEGCVCVCFLLYEALTRADMPQMQAIKIVQQACTEALGGGAIPVNDMGRYLSSNNVGQEFSTSLCSMLQTRSTPDLIRKVDAALRSLRSEVRECAQALQEHKDARGALPVGAKASNG